MTIQEYWIRIHVNSKISGIGGDEMKECLEIKNYLKENGISQAFLSRKTQIDPSKLNLSLNGERKMTLDEYCLICGALGLNTDFFIRPKLPDKKVG